MVRALESIGLSVYDFRKDEPFHWSDCDPSIQQGSGAVAETDVYDFLGYVNSPVANAGFARDMGNLINADSLCLILPCGKSAHLELGYAIGRKPTAIWLENPMQPELMYKAADFMSPDLGENVRYLQWRNTD